MHGRVGTGVDRRADDAGLGVAPETARDGVAVLDLDERQAEAGEQGARFVEADGADAENRVGGIGCVHAEVAGLPSGRATESSSTSWPLSRSSVTFTASTSTLTYLRMTSSSSLRSSGR